MITRALCMQLLLLAATHVQAADIEQTRPLSATGHVQIENLKGRIQVRTWDQPEVLVRGTLGSGVERLDIGGDQSRLVIKVVYPGEGGWIRGWGGARSEPSDIQLTLPVGASLDASGVSADIDVQGVAGARLRVGTVSGKIDASGRPGEAEFDSVSGDLRLTLEGSQVKASTVSGTIRIEGRPEGNVAVETVSGGIEVDAGVMRRLDAETVSGRIRLDVGALAPAGRINVETLSGQVELSLPADTSARLSVTTFSGSIQSDVGEVQRASRGPGARLQARMGDGSGDIQLDSFSGGVRIRTR